jgi:RimJ/RimL family protein N-acetyltransferase
MTLLRTSSETLQGRRIPLIATERLVLRAPHLEDAKTIATLLNDRRIAENTVRIPHPYALTDAQRFIGGANAGSGETVFLITSRDATVLGACGVAERAEEAPEIGYWLAFAFWGKGYATEAARAVIDYAFEDLSTTTCSTRARG